jgi:hypothetical protein
MLKWELIGKTEVLGENLPKCYVVHRKSKWPDLRQNPDRRGGKPATNRLSYGTTWQRETFSFTWGPNHWWLDICYLHRVLLSEIKAGDNICWIRYRAVGRKAARDPHCSPPELTIVAVSLRLLQSTARRHSSNGSGEKSSACEQATLPACTTGACLIVINMGCHGSVLRVMLPPHPCESRPVLSPIRSPPWPQEYWISE